MGAWGTAAWENDGAADWFGDLFDATRLAKRVEETLKQDPDEAHEEIRAAAHVLAALGRVYIWPVSELQGHLRLAIDGLERIKALEIYAQSPGLVAAIEDEIHALRTRVKPAP
jgi:hypothetical protein